MASTSTSTSTLAFKGQTRLSNVQSSTISSEGDLELCCCTADKVNTMGNLLYDRDSKIGAASVGGKLTAEVNYLVQSHHVKGDANYFMPADTVKMTLQNTSVDGDCIVKGGIRVVFLINSKVRSVIFEKPDASKKVVMDQQSTISHPEEVNVTIEKISS